MSETHQERLERTNDMWEREDEFLQRDYRRQGVGATGYVMQEDEDLPTVLHPPSGVIYDENGDEVARYSGWAERDRARRMVGRANGTHPTEDV